MTLAIDEETQTLVFGLEGRDLAPFLMPYKFAVDEMTTKIEILRQEFVHLHDYNPIEHVESRIKSPRGIIAKARRLGCPPDLDVMGSRIHDIAGVRVVCSFESDVYTTFDLLGSQVDVTVVEVEDYIAAPKPNGYRSLHAIVEVPVFMATGERAVEVELQLRTVAMDFWASTEHKIFYKYGQAVPASLLAELTDAAATAAELDARMQRLHREVASLALEPGTAGRRRSSGATGHPPRSPVRT